ncbi:hypothetical protein T4E_5194 [Trichinella pseudospiralis]|uniref:Uncharacterized protein n=1 Tax=Trichinella pseudospiralis TaxID=6337 RepID=A0A0V0XDV5_TRIPS|nr:hypothetical protein T4E_5194 [Trichinella pseudospiralis]
MRCNMAWATTNHARCLLPVTFIILRKNRTLKHWVQSSNRAQTLKQSREDLEEQLQFLNIRSPNKSSSQ